MVSDAGFLAAFVFRGSLCLKLKNLRLPGAPLLLAALVAALIGASPFARGEPLSLGSDIPYSVVKDAKGELSLDEADQALSAQLTKHRANLSQGYVRDTFWLGFSLPPGAFRKNDRWLELGPNFVDDIRVFFREKRGRSEWHYRQTGDLHYGRSDLDYRNPVFVLPPPGPDSGGYEVVIRVQSTSTIILSARLWAPEAFLGEASRTTSFWSFYFGLAALSSLLALLLSLVLKTRLLWSATAFSLLYGFVACIQGYVNWLLPTTGIPVQHYATSVLTLVSYSVLMWMSSETINLRRDLPWAHRILSYSSVITLSLVVLIPLDQYATAVKIKTVFVMLTYPLFIYSIFHIWVRDRFPLSILGLGATPMVCMIASLFGLFSAFGWVPFREEVYLVWQYALVVNMLLVLAIGVYRIREKKLAELEKQKLANELKAERDASFHQRQFMGMVAHEFRTPLAVISGAIENLQCLEELDRSPRAVRYQKIERATGRLVQLTDNCLADARLSARGLYLDRQPVDLTELLFSAASMVNLSEQHTLEITVEGRLINAPSQAHDVLADAGLMRIALSNVIDNAVKYSAKGLVSIDLSVAKSKFLIRISDEGPGIGNHNPEELFLRYRTGPAKNRGSGLGLFVARQIAQAHGGDLGYVDTGAPGSCFEFMFDFNEAA